jgi:hypothetical protein
MTHRGTILTLPSTPSARIALPSPSVIQADTPHPGYDRYECGRDELEDPDGAIPALVISGATVIPTVIRAPVEAPGANACAERWVGTVRRECLDQLLVAAQSLV